MSIGSYPKYAAVTLCGFLVFFLGFSFPLQTTDIENIVSLFLVALLLVTMSYVNRTPAGGLILGLYTSAAFLLGFLTTIFIWESMVVDWRQGWALTILMNVLSRNGLDMLSATLALASVGLFFGLLGYVFGHISLRVSVAQPRVFRDYWSSIHLLGKSDRREYSNLDRKLSSWSITRRIKEGDWWRRLVEKITEPQSDLVFVPRRLEKESPELGKGALFDLSTGRMLGHDLIDPVGLTSKYRPFVLKVAETSSGLKGIRMLAFERLVGRFLGWFIPSYAVWAFYLALSTILAVAGYIAWVSNLAAFPYYPGVENLVVSSALVLSIVTLFFVWLWRKNSRKLFEKRPDERVLIFTVYLILASLYGFYFVVITQPPSFLNGGATYWLIWTLSFLFFSLLLGFGYICVHRESEVVNMYFYDNRSSAHGDLQVSPFKDARDEPPWLKDSKVKAYWVLRFMYFWRYELAANPHPDWERVEVWVDAEKGKAEWVVSDYHYRELWYKVEGELPILYVKFLMNFHTPIPLADSSEAEPLSSSFRQETRSLIKAIATGKASEIIEHLSTHLKARWERWNRLHPADWVSNYGLQGAAAAFCSNLPWKYWRYSLGLEKAENYKDKPAARLEDQPSPDQRTR
ncbi:MAG: hypothetical protein JSV85_00780 [Candidatus Bathyarchaeota archaeon]|nr:MAG: hypothetical protein JSV85_00780 [Candidatus Bathyarchaeota archaeon]